MIEKDRTKFPVQANFPVHWGEMDAFGHVNNVAYLRYFETGRIAYFRKTGRKEFSEFSPVGPILAEQYCKYRFPVLYPDNLTVYTRIADLAESEFIHEYLVWSEAKQDIAAVGRARIVYLNYKTNKKEIIGEDILKTIESLEGRKFEMKPTLKNSML